MKSITKCSVTKELRQCTSPRSTGANANKCTKSVVGKRKGKLRALFHEFYTENILVYFVNMVFTNLCEVVDVGLKLFVV